MSFINVWDDKKVVYVARRINGEKVIETVNVDWYFCISAAEATQKRSEIERRLNRGLGIRFEREGEYIKVFVPYERRYDAIDLFKSLDMTLYEADLKLYQRYLADTNEELELNQKILYFDIETDDRQKGIEPGTARILSIATVDSEGHEGYTVIGADRDDDERRLLEGFVGLLREYDIIEGWFSEGFDLVAIKSRCDKHKIPFDCTIISETSDDLGGLHSVRKAGKFRVKMNSINHIDLMAKMKEMHYRDTELIKKVRSFSLGAIARVFVGDDKVDREGKGIYWMWENEPEKLKEYNLHDSRLLKKIDDKLNITKQKLVEHQILGARINDFTSTKKIDAFSLRGARKMGKRLFSARMGKKVPVIQADGTEEDSKYTGGYVFDPVTGLYDNLTVYDFQSLYPSIIKTFNISPDTLQPSGTTVDPHAHIVLPTGAVFSRDKGVIPRIIQSVLDERNRIRFEEMPKYQKDSFEYENLHYRQYSLKVIANSMYGVMGAEFSRYYKRECAEGITLTGQYLLKTMWTWFEAQGHRPVYGDTDSLFVLTKEGSDQKEIGKQADEYLTGHLKDKFAIEENHMHLDYEATYDRFLMQDKKKYAGSKKGKIAKMMGLEAKKRDTLPIVDKWQTELLTIMLTEKKDESFFRDWVAERQTIVMNHHVKKEDLIFQKKMSKDIKDYANENLIQVKIAKRLMQQNSGVSDGKINPWSMGSYIPWIVTKRPADDEGTGVHGVHPDEYKGDYDERHYWDKAIFPALHRTLSAAYPNINWDEYYAKQKKRRAKKTSDLPTTTDVGERDIYFV